MDMNAPRPATHNPGPSWGYAFLAWASRTWPRWFFRPMLMVGTWVSVAFLPGQRSQSRAFLVVALGRPPRLSEIWRHFFAYAEMLVLLLRVGHGARVRCELEPANREPFETLLASGRPALFGTFHFGASDLLGFLLGDRGRRVSIIRLRVGNADDIRLLGERYGARVSFLWINDPANLLFDLKAAIEAGDSLALKCDRLEFSARAEPFRFLGATRLFPFTIYHLAMLFDRPVVFCTAISGDKEGELQLFASPVFFPDPAAGREANLQEARQHFQAVLVQLEGLLRRDPSLWFNFLPLNPEVTAPVAPGRLPLVA